jgi:hypothetical protein
MTIDEFEGPEFEVWNHLESGWQMAWDDMAKSLGDRELMDFFETVAEVVVGVTSAFHLGKDLSPFGAKLKRVMPKIEGDGQEVFIKAVLQAYREGPNAWLRHAVELELARKGLDRSTAAFERFTALAPQLDQRPLPEKAEPYLKEAIQAFIFGFDAAAIALCRSGLEQVAKDVCMKLGLFTEAQLRREQPTLETLLLKLRQKGALTQSYDRADTLRERGNTVLHRHMFDEKVRRQTALDSIGNLAGVLREVLP